MQQASPPLTRTCNHDSLADSTASACVCAARVWQRKGALATSGDREGEERRRGAEEGDKRREQEWH